MSSGTRETLSDFSRGFVYTLPSRLGLIMMGKPNSRQLLEPLGMNLHPKVEYNILPKHIIEEFVSDIHNCVGTPQTSSRNHYKDVIVRQTNTNSLTMETKWLEDNIFRDPRQA
jgi:hypothetical protein